jgi:hypothetical protein
MDLIVALHPRLILQEESAAKVRLVFLNKFKKVLISAQFPMRCVMLKPLEENHDHQKSFSLLK